MIDRTTGEIRLPFGGVCISPALTRERFLASSLASQSREMVRNEPHCTFALPKVQVSGHAFSVSLWFQGSRLHRVSIECADPEFGTSWSDCSEERELARKRLHDSLLESALGRGWMHERFPWGAVDSGYDPKGGFSSIGVTYGG